ncbi:hypothetical protein QL285_055304 [Trifolium repens]|nr:hypothetical protein QL285_055304 [Trifolium repens]
MPREGKVQHRQTEGNQIKQPKGILIQTSPHQIEATTARYPPTQNNNLQQAKTRTAAAAPRTQQRNQKPKHLNCHYRKKQSSGSQVHS